MKIFKQTLGIILAFSLNACAQNTQVADNSAVHKMDSTEIKKRAQLLIDSGFVFFYKPGREIVLDTAISYFNKAMAVDGNRFLAYQLKSDALVKQGKTKLAIEPYSRWISLHPESIDVILRRGLMFYRLGFKEEADKDFNAVRASIENKKIQISPSLSPENRKIVGNNIYSYYLIGEVDLAASLLDQLEDAFPNEEKFKNASTNLRNEDREKVIRDITKF